MGGPDGFPKKKKREGYNSSSSSNNSSSKITRKYSKNLVRKFLVGSGRAGIGRLGFLIVRKFSP